MTETARRGPKRKTDLPLRTAEALLSLGRPPHAGVWAGLCSDSVVLRIGNRPNVVGRAAAEAELAVLFARTASLVEGFQPIWPGNDGATVLMEVELLTMVRAEPLPLAIILRALEPAPVIRDIRFYLDPTPLGLVLALNGDDGTAVIG